MSITLKKSTIALAASTALTAGLALSPTLVSADTNPFKTTELSSGYMQLAEANTSADKKAEATCGANKKAADKNSEATCGADKIDKAFMDNNPSYKAALGE